MSDSLIQIIETLNHQDTLREIAVAELELGRQVLIQNLGFQTGEKVVIVTDSLKKDQEAAVWFEAAKQLGSSVELIVIDGHSFDGQEPPQEVANILSTAQVALLHTSHSLTHTKASQAARRAGARVASLPSVDYELMMRAVAVDYSQVRQLGSVIKQRLENADTITITSAAGTHLTAQVRRQHIIDDNGLILSGEVGNLPAGEVFFAPLEGSTNGIWVVNGSIAGDSLDEPITITIKDGLATSITGGQAAQNLYQKLAAVDAKAFEVAEIGIGTNPIADPTASLIEAEKAYGSAHLALGNNSFFGGHNTVPIHIDGVTLQPSITLDNQLLLNEGTFYV